jgi:hypothetical protein
MGHSKVVEATKPKLNRRRKFSGVTGRNAPRPHDESYSPIAIALVFRERCDRISELSSGETHNTETTHLTYRHRHRHRGRWHG